MNRSVAILLAMLCVHCSDEPDTGTSSGTLIVTISSPSGSEKILYDTFTDVDFDHSAGDYQRTIDLRGHSSEGAGFSCLIKANVDSGHINETQSCSFNRNQEEHFTHFDNVTGSVSFRHELIEIDLLGVNDQQPGVVIEASFSAPYDRY